MNILVTGGAGFIGSSLIDRLLELNHNIVCLDNFDDFYAPSIKRLNLQSALQKNRFELVEGDLCDPSALHRCFTGKKIDVVIHLAARAGVRPSIRNPELYYQVNLVGTSRLLDAMKSANVKKLIFASSSSVYGNNTKVPFSESDSVDYPISPYAASKKAGELLCHTYYHLYGFDIFCLRLFTAYGPRQRPEMAIAKFTQQIVKGEPISLYGNGSTQRDYTYIGDIIDGIVRSMNRLRGYEIVNLGGSNTISLIDLVKFIESMVGTKAIIQWMPAQPGDVEITYADISKARRLLGYEAMYPIEKGLLAYIDWLKNRTLIARP